MKGRHSTKIVHGGTGRRLDLLMELLAFAAKPMPLVTLLDETPPRIAKVFEAEVCSIYLLEGEGDVLVMRGNVGFDAAHVGAITLAVGEGLTGEAVEYMRPVSSEDATAHASNRRFDRLREERFPIFLAVPLRGRKGALGALVVQRAERPFEPHDVELLLALGAVIAAGARHAELIDSQRERPSNRKAGGGTRKVTLTGRPHNGGKALGAIAAMRRPAARSIEVEPASVEDRVKALARAFETVGKAVSSLHGAARAQGLEEAARGLATCEEILADGRFRERAFELAAELGVARALGQVAREVTRTAASLTRDAFLEERARDVEDLCDALTMVADTDKRAELPQKAVVLGDQLSIFDLLVSARAHPVAVVLSDRASGPRTRSLLTLLAVPAVVAVDGLFRWATDGDLALVDADHGLVIFNPSRSEVAALREKRRSAKVRA